MENDVVQKEECFEIEIPYNLFQYLSTDNCDVQKLCRICLSETNKELFPLISAADTNLMAMFTAITAIQVYQNDGLPSHVCDLCRINIMSCYEFRSQCVKSDYALKSLIKIEFAPKEELSPSAHETIIPSEDADKPLTPDEIKITLDEIKKEDVSIEDVQYLEDFSDGEACIAQIDDKNQKEILDPPKKDSLLKEVKKRKKKKQLIHVCGICFEKCPSLAALRSHARRAHASTQPAFACALCEQAFDSERDLALHRPEHAPGPAWTCVECGKAFKGRSMFRRHVQRHMSCKRYACDWCSKGFSELYALRRHSRVHTGETTDKAFACHICGNKYAFRSLLNAHVARHEDVRPCVCVACGKAFPSARLLRSHRLVHQDHKPYACTQCDKRFRHLSTLRTHKRTHTGERPYVCAVCGKSFIQNSNLTLHMRIHTGDRPYSCETCGRTFSSGSTLKSHLKTHTTEEELYECPDCGRRMKHVNMRAHRRLHTVERRFSCAVCERRFATRARVQEHARLHTGEKPFECAQCSLKFISKSHLSKHIKANHVKTYSRKQASKKTSDYKVAAKVDVVKDVVSEDATDIEVTVVSTPDETSVIEEVIIPDEISVSQADIQFDGVHVVGDAGVGASTREAGGEVDVGAGEGEGEGGVRLYQLDRGLLTVSKITANF